MLDDTSTSLSLRRTLHGGRGGKVGFGPKNVCFHVKNCSMVEAVHFASLSHIILARIEARINEVNCVPKYLVWSPGVACCLGTCSLLIEWTQYPCDFLSHKHYRESNTNLSKRLSITIYPPSLLRVTQKISKRRTEPRSRGHAEYTTTDWAKSLRLSRVTWLINCNSATRSG